ncbi:hypothetical protein EVAR_56812_1 [Eumeta japonica]|uniref:Uncharacterized protein n=1 Tax=Eumeta variegata TaxID=151549 RepID=A0A4C1Y082_EUMVA|nr:hypothetical protein EVAR_56812_1 [Eumeta japonica]
MHQLKAISKRKSTCKQIPILGFDNIEGPRKMAAFEHLRTRCEFGAGARDRCAALARTSRGAHRARNAPSALIVPLIIVAGGWLRRRGGPHWGLVDVRLPVGTRLA